MKKFNVELTGSIRSLGNADIVIRQLGKIEFVVDIADDADKPSPHQVLEGLAPFLTEEERINIRENIWVGFLHFNATPVELH